MVEQSTSDEPEGTVPIDEVPIQPKRRRQRGPNRRKVSSAALVKDFASIIDFLNGIIGNTKWAEYALAPDEQEALVSAIAIELETNKKALATFGRLAALSPHLVLIFAVGRIVLRRLQLASVKRQNESAERTDTPTAKTPVPVASGRTHDGSRGHRDGQNDASSEAVSGQGMDSIASVER